ncbi:hypothetical protein [uncultured Massilia sp.]|uniref:hypothetical protein n=1 Tax=uncultured Massilia sp. TaxID=169973 RepID=UPI0025F22110|nr:hypothetical protein [uncultured Massilia sp.]
MQNKFPLSRKNSLAFFASGVLLFLASNTRGNAQDIPGNDARRYKDVCDVIEKQIQMGVSIIEDKNRGEKAKFIKNFNAAKIYRLETKDMAIEYIKTDDGRTLINEMNVNVKWLAHSGQVVAAVERQLHMHRPLPREFHAGCDAYSILVTSKDGDIAGMEMSSNFTD